MWLSWLGVHLWTSAQVMIPQVYELKPHYRGDTMKLDNWGAGWLSQTLGFGSGHGWRVPEFKPPEGLCADSTQPA